MTATESDRWSIPLFRFFGGVQLRLHLFFCLFAIWTLYFAWRAEQDPGNQGNLVAIAGQCLAILAASVLLQEIVRLRLLQAAGGQANTLVLGPYGGMSVFPDLERPRDEMLVHLGGPAISAALTGVASFILLLTGNFDWQLLHPLAPAAVAEGDTLVVIAKLALWINVVLLVLNLIPAFPFHGGRALRAAILWRAPHLGRREASRTVIRLARLIACLIVVAAVFLLREAPGLSTWSAVLLLAVLVFLGAEHEQLTAVESAGAQRSVEVVQALPIDEDVRVAEARSGSAEHERRAFREQPASSADLVPASHTDATLHDADDDDEIRVDEILMRVHEHGLNSLSPIDRAILERASRRYREKAR